MVTEAKAKARSTRSTVLIAHLARRVNHRLETDLGGAPGLRQRQLVALTFLRDHGPAPQQAMAEALSIDPSNVVLLLNELEQAGLATRRRDPTDRRRHIVEIAPAGEQALRKVGRVLDGIEDDVLGSLTAAQRGDLHELLDQALDGQLLECVVDLPVGDTGK
jgi:MarR family transcriptional regulator, transcriptional regulator for hemolysin